MIDQMEILKYRAKGAYENSYSPYSNFPVGAALKTTSGNIYAGANVENASFGLTICAERVAIFAAIADEGSLMQIDSLYVACEKSTESGPCGACRQVIREFSTPETSIGFNDHVFRIGDILPLSFGPEDL